MKKVLNERISLYASIWIALILFTNIIRYITLLYPLSLGRSVKSVIYYIFPHEVFESLRIILFFPVRNFHLKEIPFFSLLFCIFLAFAISSFKKANKTTLLKIACYLLIISIVIESPNIVRGYNYQMRAWKEYVPSSGNGILDLIDTFSKPRKPNLLLYILHAAMLAFYVLWIVYELTLIARWEKQKTAPVRGSS